jgi:hypothetical protein
MTEDKIIETAQDLQTRSSERLWGVSSASIYTALAAKSEGADLSERLSPHVQAETIRTNDERELDKVVELHDWIIRELNLVRGDRPTLTGSLVLTVEEPCPLIRVTLVAHFQKVEMILRSLEIEEDVLPRGDLDSLLGDDSSKQVLAPLLSSAGFVSIYPDSVEPHTKEIEEALRNQTSIDINQAVSEAYLNVLPNLTDIEQTTLLEDITERLTGSSPTERYSNGSVTATLVNASSSLPLLEYDKIEDAIANQLDEYELELDALRSTLSFTTEVSVTIVDTEDTVDSSNIGNDVGSEAGIKKSLVDLLSTVSANPELSSFDPDFVTEHVSANLHDIYRALSSVSGVECDITDYGFLKFHSVPESVKGDSLVEEYSEYLIKRCSAVQQYVDILSEAAVGGLSASVADEVIAQDFASLRDGDAAPVYLIYTLVNPDALGEKKMDDYVGDSRGLGRERARLRAWHENRPSGMKSYTSMTDRLFSRGIENNLNDKILRIMTPYDDDTFNEYVSQIRSLLERGFEFRLLTRHTKDPWEWKRLQRELLSEIKEHRDRVTVRTYSRFKQHQRVTPDIDFKKLEEFGIHGKLQTIGNPEEGAVLLGSANFMENSYDWNPECGVYTEQNQFVEASIEFFDIVWDISESDELSIDRLQKLPNHKLVPTYYS